ncbi:hypothetical protein HKD24_11285 [Gluconobacter sp. LMG 31484]|uniref:Uncharacterized protein n=1 Tax=Gluconobacter vitians TaxID=2728102 RepID=A0ABR9Y7Z1_9PROT|nr:hypothetical protein [Gluconobacter vitians]MBF0859796.1 hypothetical protein [Gluconobacter vitians]
MPVMPPVVVYHFSQAWDGFPANRMESGWHALSLSPNEMGAETGVVAFLAYWHADRQCWGSDSDCRAPIWALQNRMSYIGPISGASARVTVEHRRGNGAGL